MPSFRRAVVTAVLDERPGFQRIDLDDGSRAYALTQIVGAVAAGDAVVVNTTAVDLGLGTGGHHVVHLNLERVDRSVPGPGHIMKARYLSEQLDTGSWEDSTAHSGVGMDGEVAGSARFDTGAALRGVKVVLCVLHSHVPAIAASVKDAAEAPGYVMTDQSALPYALSDVAHRLRTGEVLAASVSAGQAFGADIEAVNVASGVLALAERGIRRVIVAAGPGHVGTAHPVGFSSVELAGHASVLAKMGADVAIAVRASSADERARHLEISHHSVTLLDLTAAQVKVPVPQALLDLDASRGGGGGGASWITERGHVPVGVEPLDIRASLAAAGLEVETMGRRLGDDDLAVAYLGAAAAWLAQ